MASYLRNMKTNVMFCLMLFSIFFPYFIAVFAHLNEPPLMERTSFVFEIEVLFLYSNNRCLMNSLSSTSLPLCFVVIHPCFSIEWHRGHSVTKLKDVHHLLLIEPFLVDRSLFSPPFADNCNYLCCNRTTRCLVRDVRFMSILCRK